MLSNIPIAIKLTIKELQPKLINGNGVPVRGNSPVIPPKFTMDCIPNIHPIPIAIKLPNGSTHNCAIFKERSIMAQKEDGTIMFLVIDGRQTHSIGTMLKECQDILYEKGAINAMAMDGGSSATLYLGGRVINSPSTYSHEDRYLPNAWGVTANPKHSINLIQILYLIK